MRLRHSVRCARSTLLAGLRWLIAVAADVHRAADGVYDVKAPADIVYGIQASANRVPHAPTHVPHTRAARACRTRVPHARTAVLFCTRAFVHACVRVLACLDNTRF
jgi:hypothetical protein